jgi:hypothetical protein
VAFAPRLSKWVPHPLLHRKTARCLTIGRCRNKLQRRGGVRPDAPPSRGVARLIGKAGEAFLLAEHLQDLENPGRCRPAGQCGAQRLGDRLGCQRPFRRGGLMFGRLRYFPSKRARLLRPR